MGSIFSFLAKYKFGRTLLLNHPKLFTLGRFAGNQPSATVNWRCSFSHEGPTEADIQQATFTMRFISKGYSSKTEPSPANRPDIKAGRRVSCCCGDPCRW